MLFLYLLTSPHSNLLGIYVLKRGYATEDLEWTTEGLNKALTEVLDQGLISYDDKGGVILLKKYLCHNPITNPNQLKAGLKILSSLPKSVIFQELKVIVEGLPEGLTKGLLEGLGEGFLYTATASVTASEDLKPEIPKIRFGQFCQMKEGEHDKLVQDFGEKSVKQKILDFDEYVGGQGKHSKYKDHYLVIRGWLRRDNGDGTNVSQGVQHQAPIYDVGSGRDPERDEIRKEQEEGEELLKGLTALDRKDLYKEAEEILSKEFPAGMILKPLIRSKMIELAREGWHER